MPQLSDSVNLLIVDNASPLPVSESLPPAIVKNPHIHIVRNSANIGLAANILRCIELAQSDVLWILSDDDIPHYDASEKIIRDFHENLELVFVTYSVDVSPINRERIFNDFTHFSESSALIRLGFLSTSAYRSRFIKSYLRAGYAYLNTHVPHLAALLYGLGCEDKWSVRESTNSIVTYGHPSSEDRYSPIWSIACTSLVELLPTKISKRKLFSELKTGLARPQKMFWSIVINRLNGLPAWKAINSAHVCIGHYERLWPWPLKIIYSSFYILILLFGIYYPKQTASLLRFILTLVGREVPFEAHLVDIRILGRPIEQTISKNVLSGT